MLRTLPCWDRFAGTNAMAAVGSCGAMRSFVAGLGTGMSLGANVTIATNSGSGRKDAVRRALAPPAMLAAVGGGIILGLAGELVIEPIMAAMGRPRIPEGVEAMALAIYPVPDAATCR